MQSMHNQWGQTLEINVNNQCNQWGQTRLICFDIVPGYYITKWYTYIKGEKSELW